MANAIYATSQMANIVVKDTTRLVIRYGTHEKQLGGVGMYYPLPFHIENTFRHV